MVIRMADVYSRYLEPAETGSWGATSTGEFKSGIFAMHITYPDTEYGDTIEDWESGVNSTDWRQGVTILVRTPLAASSSTIAEAKNVIAIDLKQAATDHGSSDHSYDLGTEEAARFIAAKINSRKIKMQGERDLTKYLRAKYVRQSLPPQYHIYTAKHVSQSGGQTVVELDFASASTTYPSELQNSDFSVKIESSSTSPHIAAGTYEGISLKAITGSGNGSQGIRCNVTFDTTPTITGSPSVGDTFTNIFTIIGEPAKHTIALSWETYSPSTNQGYWSAANCGPIVQGMGAIGVHRLVAKPMDGGNMGLPALNYDSRSGITANQHSSNHGYNRFSVEGLNSCVMPNMPPPDRKQMQPSVQGIISLHPDTESDLSSSNRLRIQDLEYGTEVVSSSGRPATVNTIVGGSGYTSSTAVETTGGTGFGLTVNTTASAGALTAIVINNKGTGYSVNDVINVEGGTGGTFTIASVESDGVIELENGDYSKPFTSSDTKHYIPSGSNGVHLTKVTHSSIEVKHGLNDSSEKSYARSFRTVSPTNPERVNGLQISNEERVFEPITVVDDLGNELVLEGGSPFGTVIRDFKISKSRENPTTGEIETRPSAPSDVIPPNMQIQLPKPEEIPGSIFVRSGHDRVQAWSNQTWGLGGLSAPNPRLAGDAETDSNEASQYETHDRTLIFHCQRILHDKLDTIFGLETNSTPGAVPSGTTRLFAAHRMSDHAERGSLLTQTNNGVATGNPIAHHRIRFGRQGHSFVMPLCHRGTPMSMRRQLHRSHGSAYSLMFEAETEYKHFGFGSTNTTNSSTVFELDTIDVMENSPTYATGSFVSDGLPLDELKGMRVYDADGAYTSATHRSIPDYLFAPGQKHTNVEGVAESVGFAETGINGSVTTGGATKLTLQGSTLSANNRFNTASEVMINGFFLNNYLGMGGRPEPIKRVGIDSGGNWFVRGHHEGVIRPRVATELATVPPLLHHDPELLNVAGTPVSSSVTVPSTSFTKPGVDYQDMALTKARNTGSGGEPDAFLCTWLAEYSHPTFFGTMREHFMAFRYRESGMPRSLNYPSTRGLLLRNFSADGNYVTTGSPATALPFERLYVNQWLQNYGYNGLNAGGHGNVEGLRSVSSVLMGHTTRREAYGTIQLYNQNGTARYSRGEGIGDSLNPNVTLAVVKGIDLDSDSEDLNRQFFVLNPYVGIDVSRRLPVRAWGFRTASSGPNMLAGDPTETQNTYAITNSGRFDGGKHDSMEDLPLTDHLGFVSDANVQHGERGIARSVPVGFVTNDFTAEAHPFERNVRQSNDRVKQQDEQMGIGANLGITQHGMLAPDSMAAGAWDYELNDTRPTTLPINNPVLWLKADSLDLKDGDSISKWVDSSPNAFEFVQSTASAKPTFIKRESAVNNMPVVDCDGNDYLELPFSEKLNSVEMTLFVVGFADADDGNIHGLVESRSSTPVARSGFNMYARMDSGNEYQFWGGADTGYLIAYTQNDTAIGGEAAILTGRIFGGDGSGSTATVELYQNGYLDPSAPGSATGAWYRATGGTYNVGRVPSAYFLNGKIAEVIQYDRKLTSAEQQEVESYLSRKYNLPISIYVAHTGHKQDYDNIPINKGSDPFIDLVQRSGSPTYAQQDSVGAMLTASDANSRFGHGSDFYHLRGNALHTNAHAINETKSDLAYPPNGHSKVVTIGASKRINDILPDVLNEISDTRQIQARTEPRLGLIMEVESERNSNKDVDYAVTGTRSTSLHTDLMLGHHFPVLPSHTVKTHLPNNGFTVNGTGSTSVAPDYSVKPTWSPDSNGNKGAVHVSLTDTTKNTFKTHALDHWAVRGVSELPAWGGVYILRKTYLNRSDEDEGVLNTEVNEGETRPTTSHPRRKYVDYIVRPVRPLKLFGFASDLLQDGWVLGARSSMTSTLYNSHSFDRDKRYGVFEMNYSRGENQTEPISSAGSAFTIDYPDANEYDVTWHLIPTANMLQFAKSDAHRFDSEGNFNPEIEAKYSQAQVTGGGEPIYQSETNYDVDKGIMGDHSIHGKEAKITQSKEAMRYYPRVTVKASKGGGVYLVDDASVLPPTGKLFALEHTGSITYTSISDNDVTTTGTITDANGNTVSDFTGLSLYFTDVSSSTGELVDARSPLVKQAVAPTFVDNAVIAMKIESQSWYYFDAELNEVTRTSLNYRGLLHYEPSDFIMAQQQPFNIANGSNQGVISNKNNLDQIINDGKVISEDYAPPYLIDSNNIKWRVSEVIRERKKAVMVFKDMSGKSLKDSGMAVGDVITGQAGYIGLRTTDAALHLLNDAGGNIAGITITPSNAFYNNQRDVENYLGAHPMLRQINDHSKKYVSRDTRGLNTMEVLRNLSQLDGRQIVNERNGTIVFSNKVFNERGLRIGVQNGVESVEVSKLFDSPNEIVVVGDVIAGNEIVFIRVRDSEKIKQASAGGEEEVVKTLRQQIPGVKSVSAARKLAKTLLARAENGAPMIVIKGLMNSTSIRAGDIVDINLPIQGVIGKFVVFESKHHLYSLRTDLIVAQYEKGIEGILTDLKTETIDSSGLSGSSGDKDIKDNLSMSASVNIISVHKIRVRNVNETGFIIGAKHKNGLGKIGVRDGNKRGFPIGMSKSRNYVVK